MKRMSLLLGLLFALPLFAQGPAPQMEVREGGGMPRQTQAVESTFTCSIIYNQQVGQDYFKVIAQKTIKTKAGNGVRSNIELKDLKWKVDIDTQNIFAKEGVKAILEGGRIGLQVFKSAPTHTVSTYITTPQVSIPGTVEDVVYSNDLKYVEMKGKTTSVEGQAAFVYSQKNGEGFVIGLSVKCDVKLP